MNDDNGDDDTGSDDDDDGTDDLDERVSAAVTKALKSSGPKDPPDVTGDKNIEEAMKAIVEDAMAPLRESIAGIAEAVAKKPGKPKTEKPKPEEAPEVPSKFSLRKFLVGGE